MSSESTIPVDAPGEHEDVADLLSIARVTWNRGDHDAAVSFVQRAAQTAIELELERRGLELASVAAELKARVQEQRSVAPALVPAPPPASPPAATMTPPLVLSVSPPVAAAEAKKNSVIPPPAETNPGLGLLVPADEVDVDSPRHDTAAAAPPPTAVTAVVLAAPAAPTPANSVAAPKPSPKPPQVTPSLPPRPSPGASMSPRPPPVAAPAAAPAAATGVATRVSATPPPLPARALSKPPAAHAPAASSNGASHVAHKVSVAPSVRPPAVAAGASRAPLPLRIRHDEPKEPELPAPVVPVPSVDPSAVRRSNPWLDESIAAPEQGGAAPVVLGVRARVHFRTDGSLELGPDGEKATGLAVVILPQRAEDMGTLLKRLGAPKK